jgi:MFS family permease
MAVAGMSFFMLHSSMQTEATELVPSARASAVALFACGFFAGQGIGPLWFGLLSHSLGFPGAFILSAVGFLVLGQVAARKVVTR